MRSSKKYPFLCFFLLALCCEAQYVDTLRNAFLGRKRLDIGIDSRNSFVNHDRMNVQSVKLGVSFDEKISMGLGYAWLSAQTPVFDTHTFYDKDLQKDTFLTRRLTFSYLRVYINYIYYRSRRWEFSIPLQVGVGKLGFKYNYKGSEGKSDEGFCFLYEPEVNVRFKALRWLGMEADVGYRFLFKDNKFIKNAFNSPLISVGLFIVWDELALKLFPKNEWVQKKFGPSDW